MFQLSRWRWNDHHVMMVSTGKYTPNAMVMERRLRDGSLAMFGLIFNVPKTRWNSEYQFCSWSLKILTKPRAPQNDCKLLRTTYIVTARENWSFWCLKLVIKMVKNTFCIVCKICNDGRYEVQNDQGCQNQGEIVKKAKICQVDA